MRHLPSATDLPIRYAGFGIRLLASLIDSLLLTLVLLPPLWLLYGPRLLHPDLLAPPGGAYTPPQGSALGSGWVDLLLGWVLPAVLVLLFWHTRQGTPGKLWLSLQIVDADNGRAPGLRQSLLRYLGYFLSSLPFGLGFLWVAWDPRRQGWHDKLAGTVVVVRRRCP